MKFTDWFRFDYHWDVLGKDRMVITEKEGERKFTSWKAEALVDF